MAGREQCRSGLTVINGTPHLQPVRAPWERTAPQPVARCVRRTREHRSLHGDLCMRSRSCDHCLANQ
ncbi:unnamed protein product [Staurois parvus]|uniref:Uncharacterized protein n=1 Tax=Staurois parvus TaxID=386267 RepID=A0ABN9EA27_9NEOB|nr:unnamed protein product [Staurois parvus]